MNFFYVIFIVLGLAFVAVITFFVFLRIFFCGEVVVFCFLGIWLWLGVVGGLLLGGVVGVFCSCLRRVGIRYIFGWRVRGGFCGEVGV